MIPSIDLPLFTAVMVALLVLSGATLSFLGALGLLRLGSFYDRVHPPTMGTTLGTGLVLIGSMVLFTVLESRPVVQEVLIGVFMTVTTPVTYMLLLRAALHRDGITEDEPGRPAESAPTASQPEED